MHIVREFVCMPSVTLRKEFVSLAVASNLNPEEGLGAGLQNLSLFTFCIFMILDSFSVFFSGISTLTPMSMVEYRFMYM